MEKEKELVVRLCVSLTVSKGGGPNLNTLLGFWGIGLNIFNKEFKEYTKDLLPFFKSKLYINYYTDRTMDLYYEFYSLSYLLRLCSSKINISVKGSGGIKVVSVNFISLRYFLEIVFLKFGDIGMQSLKQAYGTLANMDLYLFNLDVD